MDTQARIEILWADNLNDIKSTHRTMMHVLDAMAFEIRELRAEVESLKKCGQSYGEECWVCTRPRGHSGEHG